MIVPSLHVKSNIMEDSFFFLDGDKKFVIKICGCNINEFDFLYKVDKLYRQYNQFI